MAERLIGKRLRLFRNVQMAAIRLLGSETRARVFAAVALERSITAKRVAELTGLYPSTVRGAIYQLVEAGYLVRSKADQEGPGKRPYVYTPAIPTMEIRRAATSAENHLQELAWLEGYVKNGEETRRKTAEVLVR